jgi:hypothetical protein
MGSRQLIVHMCAEREQALQAGTLTPRLLMKAFISSRDTL